MNLSGESLKKINLNILCENIEEGERITGPTCQCRKYKNELYHRIRLFMENMSSLYFLVSQVIPFDINQDM